MSGQMGIDRAQLETLQASIGEGAKLDAGGERQPVNGRGWWHLTQRLLVPLSWVRLMVFAPPHMVIGTAATDVNGKKSVTAYVV